MMKGLQQPGDREVPHNPRPVRAALSVHSGPGSWSLPRQTELQVLLPAWGTTVSLQWVLAGLPLTCDLDPGDSLHHSSFCTRSSPRKMPGSAYDTTRFPSCG